TPRDGGPSEMSREGEAFGELCFMSGERSPATARAHSMTQVIALPRAKLTELIRHQPRMSQFLSTLAARRSRILNKTAVPQHSQSSGTLPSVGVADVLQLLQVGRKTGHLELNMAGQTGFIGLESGEVRYAKAGKLEGEDAFFQLAGWKSASFGFVTSAMA